MATGKGFICMNEIDLFQDGDVKPGLFPGADHKVVALLQSKLPLSVVREAMLEGSRYTAEEAHRKGIVDAVASVAAVSEEGTIRFTVVKT